MKPKYNTLGTIKAIKLYHLPFSNKSIDQTKKAFQTQAKKEDKVNIGESSMFTGNAWYDVGLQMGRKKAKKIGK